MKALWLHDGSTMAPRWLHDGSFMAPRWLHLWLHDGSPMAPRWLHDGSIYGSTMAPLWLHYGSITDSRFELLIWVVYLSKSVFKSVFKCFRANFVFRFFFWYVQILTVLTFFSSLQSKFNEAQSDHFLPASYSFVRFGWDFHQFSAVTFNSVQS